MDTNHGYGKEHVVNSELLKRQRVAQGRQQRFERLAQACRGRLRDLREQDQELQEQVQTYEQPLRELSLQVMLFEATGQTEERDYFPLKARQAVFWRELPALWVATVVALFQAGWMGDHDDK